MKNKYDWDWRDILTESNFYENNNNDNSNSNNNNNNDDDNLDQVIEELLRLKDIPDAECASDFKLEGSVAKILNALTILHPSQDTTTVMLECLLCTVLGMLDDHLIIRDYKEYFGERRGKGMQIISLFDKIVNSCRKRITSNEEDSFDGDNDSNEENV